MTPVSIGPDLPGKWKSPNQPDNKSVQALGAVCSPERAVSVCSLSWLPREQKEDRCSEQHRKEEPIPTAAQVMPGEPRGKENVARWGGSLGTLQRLMHN